MNKRYQVFVSSTYTDLQNERAAVIQAILELEHIPAGMEMFPAANDDQWTLIKRVIDESDYYVVVVGGRYGSQDAEGISYTEKEYDYAVESNTPILGFVHSDPGQIKSGKTDQNDAARDKLNDFRAKVEARMVKHFASPAELSASVLVSLVRVFKDHPCEGWIRGDRAMTPEMEAEVAQLRTQLAEAELTRLRTGRGQDESTDEFKQGTDTTEVAVRMSSSSPYNDEYRTTLMVTWDQIMSRIGPMLMDESTDSELRARLTSYFQAKISKIDAGKEEFKQLLRPTASIYLNEWERILVQLRAAGLIDKGSKKRQIRDTAKYYALTEKGERHLMRLLAERRDRKPRVE
ncbi:hypothetical protein RhoFasGS6_02900 [Rhodococcus fascians]|uniref:DUF4062 domain-containing protein n=1 Tax=Rhodococcoides fascians TaxID=1828 RepID=UPI001427BA29|nr:hypothetical protein [Rhodococcus fascians]